MTQRTYDLRIEPATNPALQELGAYAFASSPVKRPEEDSARTGAERSEDTTIVSYVDSVPVAKAAVLPMTMNVRGSVMPMGGIGGVCTMPVARRGGHVRALMQRAIEEMHAQGQAVSALYPFKTSYYETFGYAGWQMTLWTQIKPAALAPYMLLPKTGTIEQHLSSAALDDFYTLLEAAQPNVHGMSRMRRLRFDHAHIERPKWFALVHEGDEITGGLSYTMDLDKEVMGVRSAYWLTENARLHIFDFMARHVDQVKHISMPLLPGEHPHLWATDDDAITISSVSDHAWNAPMARVVTIAGLNGIGAGDGSIALTVHDAQAPWNTGAWTFTGRNGELEVSKGGQPAGEVTINGLSALVMSGLDPNMLPYRGWGQVQPEAAETLRSLFPPVVPYLHEQF